MRRSTRLLAPLVAAVVVAAGALVAWSTTSQAAETAIWKIDCSYSHSAPDDPILFPGAPGASHLHDFFGNVSTNANSTYESMKGVTSTCVKGDRGAYWVPTLYRNGKVVHPDGAIVYYSRTAYDEKFEAFPKDFRMIVGNSKATTPAEQSNRLYWGCHNNDQISYTRKEPPTNCKGSNGIQLRIDFPSCWDGKTDAIGNATAHMKYPSGGDCPDGYPHAFPRIGLHIGYDLGTPDVGEITFSSGNLYSVHADFWNTWEQDVLEQLVADCSNGGNVDNCGHFTNKNTGAVGSPGLAAPDPAVSTPSPSVTTPSPSVSTPSPSVTTPAPSTSPGTPAQPISAVTIQQKKSGRCITAVSTKSRKLKLADCRNTKSQKITPTTTGSLKLAGQCLGPAAGRSARVQLSPCSKAKRHTWQLTDTGSILNGASGKCLDTRRQGKKTLLALSPCTTTPAQTWIRTSV